MTQQEGFSLIEVLASLLLMATIALVLLQQQLQNRQLLGNLVLRTQDSLYSDQMNEMRLSTFGEPS